MSDKQCSVYASSSTAGAPVLALGGIDTPPMGRKSKGRALDKVLQAEEDSQPMPAAKEADVAELSSPQTDTRTT